MNILREPFSRNHGVLKHYGEGPHANFEYSEGNLTFQKTTVGWGQAGFAQYGAIPKLGANDEWRLKFTPKTNKVGSPAQPDVTFYQMGLALDRPDGELSQDPYGIYVQGGSVTLSGVPGFTPIEITIDRGYELILDPRDDGALDVYLIGFGMPGLLGQIPGGFAGANRKAAFVFHCYSEDVIRFNDFTMDATP